MKFKIKLLTYGNNIVEIFYTHEENIIRIFSLDFSITPISHLKI